MNKLLVKSFLTIVLMTTLYSPVHCTLNQSLVKDAKNMSLKYILQWTDPNTEPFIYMGKGQDAFIKKRCPVNNCFVTSQETLLDNITDFDAILFHGPELYRSLLPLPTKRSLHQKYVFVSMESSAYYPLCHKRYDNFFNWTWTYKLNSDEYFGYMIIRDKRGDIIGPKKVMHWLRMEDMKPIDDELKEKLKDKKVAAAWFVSNCKAPSGRDEVAKQLGEELAKYNMTLDKYGYCGTKKCPRNKSAECLQKLETDYYFYLSFENSFSEDYVTEKLLKALQHYAVPIVYGGANYTRFLPDGSYLNARTLTIQELVKQIVAAIHDKEKYYNYFRWHNHYSYHGLEEMSDTDSYCQFCKKINDADLMKQITTYDNFSNWWISETEQKTCSSATTLHLMITLYIVVGFANISIFFNTIIQHSKNF